MTTSQTREAREMRDDAKTTARNVADDVATHHPRCRERGRRKASAVAARLPEAAATTRAPSKRPPAAWRPAPTRCSPSGRRSRSDSRSACCSAAPTGFSSSLALIPATAMGFTLLDRYGGDAHASGPPDAEPPSPADAAGSVARTHEAGRQAADRLLHVWERLRTAVRGPRRAERPEEGAPGVRGIGVEDAPSQASPRGELQFERQR